MTMSLKDKLRELERVPRPDKTPPAPPAPPLEQLLGGSEQEGCFVVERRYPLHQPHGVITLARLRELPGAVLGIAAKDDSVMHLTPDRALFLDTETTGLAGGSGTLAFLVGVGYFEQEDFVVRQYFLRQPHEERAMLAALQRHLAERHGLVTFNGKSFDIPLLLTRTVLHRLPIDLDGQPHFDVLHAARRLWKARLQDCSLGNLETQILGAPRRADVPGALIPQIYFDFVRTGRAGQLPEVLAHNRRDLLTTAALVGCIGRLVQSPFQFAASRQELQQVGRLYREAGELETSIKLFEELIQQQPHRLEDHLALGLCYKSQRRYDDANRVWQRLIEDFPFHPLPFIEFAKHLEHRRRDYRSAHAVVQRALRALAQIEELHRQHHLLAYKADLARREARLRRKQKTP
ncbi:MAG: ribonuclease H-like domain-containing protein [candidate division KSB1 bacterium]|nr:ribonuclease H-like domain-containing protein [candidate division KSB1 bacterium]MDZ7274739.1 ribonuclease H-like domain-containing protein [candidate division KSB1 bacterium]MDZ7285564.1 ribonuclease H-like domain-containing protein [candidate division KSB1 bacterium]MDZ7298596.1 ribonuclease H-like domain-containing protein [candidate division KSB1 bacterium]MDZ7306775.1 ribonuclease H-like domain-containing protein [candidate division KSB1 bacterium]